MPFFPHASGLTIENSHMYDVGGDYVNIHLTMPAESTERIGTQLLRKRKERDLDKGDAGADGPRKRFREVRDETLDGLMIVDREDIDLDRQLTSGSNYCTHSASYKGRVVAVKVFHGSRAKQSWELNLALAKAFLHSNVPKIVGISGENRTESPFIIFHGISDRKMNSLLAKALRTDLNKSVQLSMKTVKGLAAGLSYMKSRNLLSKGIVENFDIFASGSDEPVLSIHLPDTTARGPHLAPSFYHPEDHRGGTEILSGLCLKLFSDVNSILYDDFPERELDADNSVVNYPRVFQTHREGNSNAGDISSSTEVRTSHKTRREVQWKFDKSSINQSLESIVRRFEDYLDCVSASSADSPLRRITASPHKWDSHRCPGYLREEITLTADVSRSVVIAHQYPSQSEICTICGQLVQYPCKPALRRTKRQRQPPPKINIPTSSSRSYVPYPFSAQSWATWQPDPADADWSVATPETQTVNIQTWGSVPGESETPKTFGPASPEPTSSNGSGWSRSVQPSPTAAAAPPSRVVDEDYDGGVADALTGLASYRAPELAAPSDGPTHSPTISSGGRHSDPSPQPPQSHRNSVSSTRSHASPTLQAIQLKRARSPSSEESDNRRSRTENRVDGKQRVSSTSIESRTPVPSTRPSPIPFRTQPHSLEARQTHDYPPSPPLPPVVVPPHPRPIGAGLSRASTSSVLLPIAPFSPASTVLSPSAHDDHERMQTYSPEARQPHESSFRAVQLQNTIGTTISGRALSEPQYHINDGRDVVLHGPLPAADLASLLTSGDWEDSHLVMVEEL